MVLELQSKCLMIDGLVQCASLLGGRTQLCAVFSRHEFHVMLTGCYRPSPFSLPPPIRPLRVS